MYKNTALYSVLFFLISTSCTPDQPSVADALPISDREYLEIVPLPSSVRIGSEKINLKNGIYLVPALYSSKIIGKTLMRFVDQMRIAGISTSNPAGLPLNLDIGNEESIPLGINLDESYSLELSSDALQLSADNFVGLNHGLSTLGQLLYQAKKTGGIYEITIEDQPRYPWRGLMIDVCRHWIPKNIILKNLDAMASAKMNVLHLHLSDDQGFRIASKLLPRLHLQGSNQFFYSQDDIKEIIAYAHDRGIRVIPEFAMPGHTTSWLVGYPDLGSKKIDYQLEKGYGVYPNILNPAAPKTYAFIQTLFQEMVLLFPDEYIHIGGNEFLFDHWTENSGIQSFMTENELVDLRQLSAYFNLKVEKILQDLGRKVIIGDYVLPMGLNKDEVVIQAWNGHRSLFEMARQGLHGILSGGWYLDHKLPISEMYRIDPSFDNNQVYIIPDSSNYKIWKLSVRINNMPSEGHLILFDRTIPISGVIQLMGQQTTIKDATYKDGKLMFSFNGGFGNAQVNTQISDNSLSGNLSLSVGSVSISGEKVGGNDFENGIGLGILSGNNDLSEVEQNLILGGEACLWTEWVDEKNILSRIWPSTGAVAEKLWSPKELTKDVQDFYRRSLIHSEYLKRIGVDFTYNRFRFITEVSKESNIENVSKFIDVLEEVKYNDRWSFDVDHSIEDSMDHVADAVLPESMTSYNFGLLVEQLDQQGPNSDLEQLISQQLEQWIPLYRSIVPVFKNDKMQPLEVLALALSDLSKIAAHVMESGTLTEKEAQYYSRLKINSQRRIDGVFLAPATHLINIIDRFRTEL